MPVIQDIKISGVSELIKKLQARGYAASQETNKKIVVGYKAAYALYIHENRSIWPPGMRLKGKPRSKKKNRGLFWDPQGKAQPKFLEEPARTLMPEMARIIITVAKDAAAKSTPGGGNNLGVLKGMLLAGLRLQRASQELVPVDVGNLKNSAFCDIVPA